MLVARLRIDRRAETPCGRYQRAALPQAFALSRIPRIHRGTPSIKAARIASPGTPSLTDLPETPRGLRVVFLWAWRPLLASSGDELVLGEPIPAISRTTSASASAPPSKPRQLLLESAAHGNPRAVKILLTVGAAVEAKDLSGHSPLRACWCWRATHRQRRRDCRGRRSRIDPAV